MFVISRCDPTLGIRGRGPGSEGHYLSQAQRTQLCVPSPRAVCSPQSSHLTPVSCPRRPRTAARHSVNRQPSQHAAHLPLSGPPVSRAPSAQFGAGLGTTGVAVGGKALPFQ